MILTLLSAISVHCHLVLPYAVINSDGAAPDKQRDARTDTPVADSSKADALITADVGPFCPAGEVQCKGICISGDDCTKCSSAKLFCKTLRACVLNCSSECHDLYQKPVPIECYACDLQQGNPIGTCEDESPSGFCLNADYTKAFKGKAGEHCDCSNTEVANCLGSQHVCKPARSTDWCITCGEAGQGTHGLPCKGGGTCNTSLSPPRCQ